MREVYDTDALSHRVVFLVGIGKMSDQFPTFVVLCKRCPSVLWIS